MLELRTFGGLSIAVDGALANGAATHRKTLALLALLAAAKHGISRDKLIAYLWSESDAAHGRSLLKQACYALRRDLHAPDLILGTTELRLNPEVVHSDVRQFEDALERRDHVAVVALYGGPFLDGFYLSDAEEFERWVDGERSRLASEVFRALELLAREARVEGRHQVEADHWRQLTRIDPLNGRAAIGLMRALDEAGERVAALQHGDAYEARVRKELDAEPAAELIALMHQLRTQARVATPRATAAPDRSAPPSPPAPRPSRRGAMIAVVIISVIAIGGVLVAATELRGRSSPPIIAVGAIRDYTGSYSSRPRPCLA